MMNERERKREREKERSHTTWEKLSNQIFACKNRVMYVSSNVRPSIINSPSAKCIHPHREIVGN
jgi:hypothetical protein